MAGEEVETVPTDNSVMKPASEWEQRNGAVPGICDQEMVFIKEGTYLAK